MASLQGAKAWIGDKFARLHAYIKSVPPDVWLGLAIGAGVLILAWLAYKHSQGSSTGQDGTVTTSTDTPIIPDTSTSGTNNIIPSLFGPGDDGNSGNSGNSGHISGIFKQQKLVAPTSGPLNWIQQAFAAEHASVVDVNAAAAKANASAARLAPSQAFSAEHAIVYNSVAQAAAKAPSQAFAAEHAAVITHPLAKLATAFAAEHRPVTTPKPPTGLRQDVVY